MHILAYCTLTQSGKRCRNAFILVSLSVGYVCCSSITTVSRITDYIRNNYTDIHIQNMYHAHIITYGKTYKKPNNQHRANYRQPATASCARHSLSSIRCALLRFISNTEQKVNIAQQQKQYNINIAILSYFCFLTIPEKTKQANKIINTLKMGIIKKNFCLCI